MGVDIADRNEANAELSLRERDASDDQLSVVLDDATNGRILDRGRGLVRGSRRAADECSLCLEAASSKKRLTYGSVSGTCGY